MPTFMDSLASNPSGGVYGQPAADDPLKIINQLKDREFNDYKNKALFMSDLSLKQDRLRKVYGLDGSQTSGQNQEQQPMNTVMAKDPDAMTGYQKAQINMDQQQLGLDKEKLAQSDKLGEERLGIQSDQQKLNQQKSDQINVQKQADMERKISEADQRIELARQGLEQKTTNAAETLAAHKEYQASVEERHKLELAQKDAQFKTVQEQHKAALKVAEDKLKQASKTQTTTQLNPDGTKKIVTTQRGGSNRIKVIGPNGETGTVDADDELPEGWMAQ